jgi:uncharacterized protein (TIGR02186 family)
MKRRLALVLAGCLAFYAMQGHALAEKLIISLSTHRVLINSTYTGAQMAVFGVIQRDSVSLSRVGNYDVVVTIRGPRETVVVREKQRLGFIWVNREQRRFIQIPAFVQVLASKPLQDIIDGERGRRLGMGLAPILSPADQSFEFDTRSSDFRTALVRLRYESGLFREYERGVTFLTPDVFRAIITMPAIAAVGSYEVEVALFSDSVQLERQSTNFEVVKTGFEADIADAAQRHGWLYGLAAAVISLLFGWIASVIFRRD